MEDHPVWRNGTLTSAHRHAERQRIERKVARVAADVNAIGLDLGMRDGLRQHAIDHLRRMDGSGVMRNEPARRADRATSNDRKELDERIKKLVVRILSRAALDAHGRDRADEAWADFRQN